MWCLSGCSKQVVVQDGTLAAETSAWDLLCRGAGGGDAGECLGKGCSTAAAAAIGSIFADASGWLSDHGFIRGRSLVPYSFWLKCGSLQLKL